MAAKTATAFSLALFPPVFVFERVLHADVVFLLSDRTLDDKNHLNRCVIRAAAGGTRTIEIPVRKNGVRIDDADVSDDSTWLPRMQDEVRRSYAGLAHASAANDLVSRLLPPYTSPWLTDYLMHSFVVTLKYLGWEKEIIRGITQRRQRYVRDDEYLLDLCHEHQCKRFIVGAGPEIKYRKLFREEGVTIESQKWPGTSKLPGRDSILDAIARFSVAEILDNMRNKT